MAKKNDEQQTPQQAVPEQLLPGTEVAVPVEAKRAEIQIGELAEMANVIDISSDAEFQKANEYRQTALRLEKEIEAAFDPIVDAAYKAHKTATTTRARFLEPVVKLKKLIADKMAKWQTSERERLQKEAAEAEAKRRAEAEEQQKREAAAFRDQGEEALAQVVESTPVVIAEEKAELPKAQGFTTQEVWDFRIKDITKLNPAFLIANEVKIRQIVKSMKTDAHTIVGAGAIEIFSTNVPVNRG